jgi:hypothetical protein
MQAVLDDYLVTYNTQQLHQGRGMSGRTPIVAFVEGISKKTGNTEINTGSRLTLTPQGGKPLSRTGARTARGMAGRGAASQTGADP